MVTAIASVVLIAVGLPLLAWWLGGRAFWARLRGRPDRDPWGDLVRAHALSAAEAARVTRDVPRGVRFAEPWLRAATVDWAHEPLGTGRDPWPRSERARSWVTLALVCWIALIVARTVFRVVTGHAGDVHRATVVPYAGIGTWVLRRRRLLRRTLAENGGVALAA